MTVMKWRTVVWSDGEDPEMLPETETYREALEQAQNHVRGTNKQYKIIDIGIAADTLKTHREHFRDIV